MRYRSSAKPAMRRSEMREYWEESFQTYDDFRPPREQLRLDDTIDLAKLLKEARVPREYRL